MPYVWFFISVLNVYIFLMYVRDNNIYLTHTWWMMKTSFLECISRKLEQRGARSSTKARRKENKVIWYTIFLTQRAEARETRTTENFERDRSIASDSSSQVFHLPPTPEPSKVTEQQTFEKLLSSFCLQLHLTLLGAYGSFHRLLTSKGFFFCVCQNFLAADLCEPFMNSGDHCCGPKSNKIQSRRFGRENPSPELAFNMITSLLEDFITFSIIPFVFSHHHRLLWLSRLKSEKKCFQMKEFPLCALNNLPFVAQIEFHYSFNSIPQLFWVISLDEMH